MERALHDSLCAIKRTLESGSVVPGGGAVETALSIYLENFATTLVRLLPPDQAKR
jgi:T-complex protein 1 subunit alpha